MQKFDPTLPMSADVNAGIQTPSGRIGRADILETTQGPCTSVAQRRRKPSRRPSSCRDQKPLSRARLKEDCRVEIQRRGRRKERHWRPPLSQSQSLIERLLQDSWRSEAAPPALALRVDWPPNPPEAAQRNPRSPGLTATVVRRPRMLWPPFPTHNHVAFAV